MLGLCKRRRTCWDKLHRGVVVHGMPAHMATFGANESSVGQTTRAPSSGPAEQPQEKGSNSRQKEVPKAGHKGRGIRRVGEESSCNPCQRGSAEV